ncbi:sensor histidine kinase [Psychroflexus sediminis]|uniref:Histidine kinase n=1 Tax=Psychroflexus sediminis TaxID=470826 RepID=A0A1G7W7I1_9FLAO|nr:histidine kinase [Psychroflexus sediminis]SDG67906.1 Histidine kinase [Psychroflexus sediminis]
MEANQVSQQNQSPESVWNKFPFWIRRIAIAAIITISIHLSFSFIIRGTFISDLDITDAIELPFSFLYILALFWIYPWISRMVHSAFLSRVKKIYVKFIEGFTVVVTTVLLTLLVRLFPLWLALLFINSVQDDINLGFSPDQVRRSFIIHAIIGLFFYYFVERQRIRKQLQKEQLQRAQLQKEKFRVDLENLKDQVNPEFLFNSLNFLDKFIQENPKQAEEFVERLSNVYRSFLNRQEELISLEDEALKLKDYLYLLHCRFKDKISFKMEIEKGAAQHVLPPGALQSLIENFITGIRFEKEAILLITIHASDQQSILKIGFNTPLHTNVSMDSVLKNLNKRYGYFTTRNLELKKTKTGTQVSLPLLKLEKRM